MRLTDIKSAWNKQADERHQWETLDADERVEFALYLVGKVSHDFPEVRKIRFIELDGPDAGRWFFYD